MWNNGNATLVHIDVLPAYEERNLYPDVELVGNIAATLNNCLNASTTSWCLAAGRRDPCRPPASAGVSTAAVRT